MKNSTTEQDHQQPTPCPSCGGALEISLGVWATDVVLATPAAETPLAQGYTDGVVVDCAPAFSADCPDGINVGDEWRVSCRDCGDEVAAHHGTIPSRWTYQDPAEIDRALRPIAEVLAWAREHHQQQGAALPGTWWVPEALQAAHDALTGLRPADPSTEG